MIQWERERGRKRETSWWKSQATHENKRKQIIFGFQIFFTYSQTILNALDPKHWSSCILILAGNAFESFRADICIGLFMLSFVLWLDARVKNWGLSAAYLRKRLKGPVHLLGFYVKIIRFASLVWWDMWLQIPKSRLDLSFSGNFIKHKARLSRLCHYTR